MTFKLWKAILACSAIAAAAAIALPAAASANTVWVSSTATPRAPYNNCEHPGYSHIQPAIEAPTTTVHICKGTYAEQLTITRPVNIEGNESTLDLPVPTAFTHTPCDAEDETIGNRTPDQDAVSICTSGVVKISKLHVDAVWPGEPVGTSPECGYSLYGILVAGGAEFSLTSSEVVGARPAAINGCQYGVGVQIGMSSASLGEATATLTKDLISGYQKNGITVEGASTSAKITSTEVTGAGPTPVIAQNGIGVQEGAKATISTATVTGNECNEGLPNGYHCGSDLLTQYGGAGVYFYHAAPSTLITSHVNNNDIGADVFDEAGAQTISRDEFAANRSVSVAIEEGSATVNYDTMSDSDAGIELLQFHNVPSAVGGTGAHDTISGMSEWAVFGRSDNEPGDVFGEFTITASKISGNPGSTPLKSVETESPTKLKIYAEKDT